jgi:hypothetical protein
LSPEICGAITGADTDAFRVIKAYQATDWLALSSIASKLGYSKSKLPKGFLAASRASGLSG